MQTRDKLALGAIAAAGTMWGARAWLRSRRWIELHDLVVVITGSDGGFGLIQARMVAQQGAIVVLAARDAEALKRRPRRCGGRVHARCSPSRRMSRNRRRPSG